MRSHRLRSRTSQAALRPKSGDFDGQYRHPDCGTGRTRRIDARGAARRCLHRRARRAGPGRRVCSGWHLERPRRGVDHRHQLELAPAPDTVPDNTATFSNNGADLGHHLEQRLDQHHRRSTSRHRPIRSPFRTRRRSPSTAPATVRRSCRTSASAVVRRWRSGTEAWSRSARWRARRLAARRVRSQHPPVHRGKHEHDVLGRHQRPRLHRARRRRNAEVDRHGQRDRRRSRPLPLLDGLAHHRRRHADRQRLRPGRDGRRRNAQRHQWRHAASRADERHLWRPPGRI